MDKWIKLGMTWMLCSMLGISNSSAIAVSQKHPPFDILVLLSYNPANPWSQSMMKGFLAAQQQQSHPIRYYFEFWDTIRLGETVNNQDRVTHLSEKYKNIQFEAAVADSPEASRFLKSHGDQLIAQGIPRIYSTDTDLGEISAPNEFIVRGWKESAIKNTVDLAITQNPDSTEIIIVRGTWAAAQMVHDSLKKQLSHYPHLQVRTLDFVTFDQLREQLADLPEKSLLFYTLIFKDALGNKLEARQVLQYIAEHSQVPVYSFWKNMLGAGIVGGSLRDGERLASSLIEAVMDYTQHGHFKTIYPTTSWGADWKRLQQHGLQMSNEIGDITYINRPPDLVEHYFREIIWVITLFFAALVVLALYWIRKVIQIKRQLQYTRNCLIVEQRKQGKTEATDTIFD